MTLEIPEPDGLPVMALRPTDADPDLMDDIVVEDVVTFRAEAMSDDSFWVCCYLRNGERITWNVTARARPKRLEWAVGETPEYIDWDLHPESRPGAASAPTAETSCGPDSGDSQNNVVPAVSDAMREE